MPVKKMTQTTRMYFQNHYIIALAVA